jgi:hypothetical protein
MQTKQIHDATIMALGAHEAAHRLAKYYPELTSGWWQKQALRKACSVEPVARLVSATGRTLQLEWLESHC